MFGLLPNLRWLIRYVVAWLINHCILLMGIIAMRVPLLIDVNGRHVLHQCQQMSRLIL
ncbi:hypothetical protein ES703_117521 [subsurface metagenome]